MAYIDKLFCYNVKDGGYIALISVLVVGAIGVAVATTLILLGLSSSKTSFSYEQSAKAKSLASTCAEEALEQIRSLSSFSGSGGLSLGVGACSYNVTIGGGESRIIDASGTVGNVVRKVKVLVAIINPAIVISSWQEVADF